MALPSLDPDAFCPKCGHENARMAYCPGGDASGFTKCRDVTSEEHIHRVCSRCAYECLQACYEPPPPSPPAPLKRRRAVHTDPEEVDDAEEE